jgi:arylsulfatase A-like enzyme
MIHRCYLVFLFLLLGVQSHSAQPNVVLFLADDMGWMDSAVYGSTYYETPNIDRFAKRAMRFTNAYSQPLCSPTRASLLTGQYSARHGITSATGHIAPQEEGFTALPTSAPPNAPMLLPESKNFLEPSQITLAETLKGAGYHTAHIGKWHLGLTQPHWPEQQGFDSAFHCHPDPGPPGNYFSPYGVSAEGKASAKNKIGTITDGPAGEYIVDRQAAEAVKFIDANKSGPFFLNLWCYGVHGPWGHKEEYTRYFANKKDPSSRQGNPIMASMLKSVDECFGRILDELEKQGIADNTIILFTSDNGGNVHSNIVAEGKKAANDDWQKWAGTQPPTFNTPLRDGKGTLYEGGTRVPMMWSWAGKIKPGSTTDTVVGPIDVYPTLLELLEIAKPAQQHFDGVSYAKVLKSEGALERTAYFNYHPHAGANRAGGVWVRQGDFKLLRWFGNPATHELYNLHDDLSEATDLAAKMPDKVKELEALIDGFLKDTHAAFPQPNPAYQPRPTAKPADPLAGLVPKFCHASISDGALHIEATGRTPFLGTGQVKLSGPMTLKLRVRSSAGGAGKVQWRTAAQTEFPPDSQITSFTLPAGSEWQDITVDLPMVGACGTLRLFLPADKAPVEIQTMDFSSTAGKSKRWSFATP